MYREIDIPDDLAHLQYLHTYRNYEQTLLELVDELHELMDVEH
jgi:hypothetical protein